MNTTGIGKGKQGNGMGKKRISWTGRVGGNTYVSFPVILLNRLVTERCLINCGSYTACSAIAYQHLKDVFWVEFKPKRFNKHASESQKTRTLAMFRLLTKMVRINRFDSEVVILCINQDMTWLRSTETEFTRGH